MSTSGLRFRRFLLCGICFLFFAFLATFSISDSKSLEKLYFDAQFSQIVMDLEKRNDDLSFEEKILFIECLARTSRGKEAGKEIEGLLSQYPDSSEVLAVAGIVAFSQGRMKEARLFSDRASKLDPDEAKAILTLAFLDVYHQEFAQAQSKLNALKKMDPIWKDSYFLYLFGLELSKSAGNVQNLQALYQEYAKRQKNRDKDLYENAKQNSKMFKRITENQLFRVLGPEKIVINWERKSVHRENVVTSLSLKQRDFQLVFDTGNAVGWMVHSRDLYSLLNSRLGGRALTQIGLISGMLYGHNLLNAKLTLDGFEFHDLLGMYVPKPHPSFYDANLNPVFLRDRVVTIDYVNKVLLFRTKNRFEQDLETASDKNPGYFEVLPYLGYERPLVPMTINDRHDVLCLIDTGAEDITVRLELARKWKLPLEPEVRYLANGQVFHYSTVPLKINAGKFVWNRRDAEVWPLDRFYDRLTGLSPDLVIGPEAFKDKYVISFDPFNKQVILSDFSY